VSRNIQRRHLMKESQRALIGARIANLQLGANQHSEGVSIDTASDWLNISRESILRARKALASGIPELVQAVDAGELAVSAAAQISVLSQPQQHEAMKHRRAGSPAKPVIASAPALAPSEAEVAASGPAEGFDGTGAAEVDTPEAGQAQSVSSEPPASTPEPTMASVMESSPSGSGDRWLWPGYIPASGVTAIVGSFNGPTTLVVVEVAATVSSGGAWPGYR
jgi:hypothetical protein